MTGQDTFGADVVPLLRAEVDALHHGDLAPRLALWSRREPLTLFGAWLTATGWVDIEKAFDRLAETFGGSEGLEYEVVAAECSGDLGYVVALERSAGLLFDGERRDYTVRVTTVLRREHGSWRVVHRHGDALPLVAP